MFIDIFYLYYALGYKLKKNFSDAQNQSFDSYYQGSVLLTGGKVIVMNGEGRSVKNSTSWDYEYDLKDHLGNTRISFLADNGQVSILQVKDYYPFGMEMVNGQSVAGDPTKYLYNGKELQDEAGLDFYDYGARFYDPAIGRWHSVDPLTEKYRRWSPYNYCVDNPMRFIDPDGMGAQKKSNDPKLIELQRLQRISEHSINGSNAFNQIFNKSDLNLEGSWKTIGGNIKTTLLSAKGEVGIVNGSVQMGNENVKVKGSLFFANAEINTVGELGGAKTEIAAAEGELSIGKFGDVSADGKIGVATQELTYPGKDGVIGVGIDISKLKIELYADLDKFVTAINEFLGIFDELGAFGQKDIPIEEIEGR